MKIQNSLVVVSAEPVLGKLIKENQHSYYVQHWLVSGYHWDGDCLCSAVHFKNVKINVHDLTISNKLIRNKLEEVK